MSCCILFAPDCTFLGLQSFIHLHKRKTVSVIYFHIRCKILGFIRPFEDFMKYRERNHLSGNAVGSLRYFQKHFFKQNPIPSAIFRTNKFGVRFCIQFLNTCCTYLHLKIYMLQYDNWELVLCVSVLTSS